MQTRSQNSLVGVMNTLLTALRQDLVRIHLAHSKEIHRDFDAIQKRLDHEGITFLTSTLPALGKAVLQGCLSGRLEAPQGFKKLRGTTLPRLLSGLLVQGFEIDGALRKDCKPVVVKSLLQVTFLAYKLELPFTRSQIKAKVEGFLKAERDLRHLSLDAGDPAISKARELIQEIFREFNPREIIPGHGPGALATGEKNEGKWSFKRKYLNLHRYYPYYEYFVPSRLALLNRIKHYRDLEDHDYAVSEMRFVPKDSRGPRIISMEPLEIQFIQQGLKTSLYKHIERHPLTKGFVNFSDQSINGRLALAASATGDKSTLDMKEASDRVSLQLVRCLFHGTELLSALEAVRSQYVHLPLEAGEYGDKVVKLYKYAPMGSAVCFPVEALCFWALSVALILLDKGDLGSRKLPVVHVYGDDIIVDTVHAKTLVEHLPEYGLLVNPDKSYTSGPFRESCGFDCFAGEVVTPIKIRKLWPTKRSASAEELTSYAEYSNSFWENGYYATAEVLAGLPGVKSLSRLPRNSRFGTGIRRDDSCLKTRWNKDLQHTEAKATAVTHRSEQTKLDSYQRLFANLLGKLQRQYDVPHASNCKLRWVDALCPVGKQPDWVERLFPNMVPTGPKASYKVSLS